jgi:hypothetical protein
MWDLAFVHHTPVAIFGQRYCIMKMLALALPMPMATPFDGGLIVVGS